MHYNFEDIVIFFVLGCLVGILIVILMIPFGVLTETFKVDDAILCAKAGYEPDLEARTCVIVQNDSTVLECKYVHANGVVGLKCKQAAQEVLFDRRL